MKTFALIGAAGYIAPRHMRAIKAVGGDLAVALDPSDSVGIIDSHFPDAHFFVEFERFDRHIDKLRRAGRGIDFVSVCSPNYLHDAHCRFGMRANADVICEKPLVLNPWNIDGLSDIEQETGRRISTILQLRLHPALQALKARIDATDRTDHEVVLTYVTSRGKWYNSSWKGDTGKAGGVATNIGIHFFDMLTWLFGPVTKQTLYLRDRDRAAGTLQCGKAEVRWFLSVDRADLPAELKAGQTTFRSVAVDGEEVEFSEGFTDLHTRSYEEILAGRGFGIDLVRPSINIASAIRDMTVVTLDKSAHPFALRR
ncbi:Gfo/Idh/MocA family oxidoreductase [Tardiphaga alba]|uniref:Gfo/Idh/MocA family oxidoreductase n=1 Tax=Tardiphaga alba TaxID=340268 RepID=A0ABX8A660_9BRAD|nr:Gfo/Idh/MocA family oxidoreductase [Tardiphaga alba]QUS39133.1 Gfo/Idh/MocA family oxidoreductase [Tardiphaga alba]